MNKGNKKDKDCSNRKTKNRIS